MPSRKRNKVYKGKTKKYLGPEENIVNELGDGFYFIYDERHNGYGGFFPSDLTLYNETGVVKQILDRDGCFIDFPGIRGNRLYPIDPFEPQVVYFVHYWMRDDGNIEFHWTVSPDSRYSSDEEGFGWEPSEEIVLISVLDRNGEFIEPFHEEGL